METNKRTLVNTVLEQGILDDRFVISNCVNCDPATGEFKGKGRLSVVFKAEDQARHETVAVKFLDPDRMREPDWSYRYEHFVSESRILEQLIGTTRFLQLVQPLHAFDLLSDPKSQEALAIPAYYIVTEWLSADILPYCYQQEEFDASEKLIIFRQILLATAALHSHGYCHRDLKFDNFRLADRDGARIVVPIDLGSALEEHSAPSTSSRAMLNMGAPGYAPPEALAGLAWVRDIGRQADFYALGCMLFDLFNADFLFSQLAEDPGFATLVLTGRNQIGRLAENCTGADAVACWRGVMAKFKVAVRVPDIAQRASTVPAAISEPLQRLMVGLTDPDFQTRWDDPAHILRHVDSALRIMHNQRYQRRIKVEKDARRRRRQAKLRRRIEKSQLFLADRASATS